MNAITQVCYNSTPRHINSVKVAPVLNNGKLGAEYTATRQAVIDAIRRNEVYYTYKNGTQGAKVEAVPVRNNYYLRTDRNSEEEDNLGELPRFNC